MRNLLTIIIFVLMHFNILNAEIVKKVEITGNKRVSDQTILIYGKIEINENYERKILIKCCRIYMAQIFLKM